MKEQSETEQEVEQAELIQMGSVAKLLGVSLSHLHTMRRKDLLGPQPVILGGSKRWSRSELLRWIAAKCPDATTWARIKEQTTEVVNGW